MEDHDIRAALDRHWAASDANDFEAEHQIHREDAVLEYPQSDERIRGRRNIQASRFAQPSRKRFTVRRILGAADLCVADAGSHPTRRWRGKDSNPRSPVETAFSRPPRNPATTSRPGRPNRVLTIDKGRFTVRRARLAPAMISTPGHRASRRRQRGALPAW